MRVFIVTAMMIVLAAADAFAAQGAGDVRAGNALYHQGKFQDALKHYEKAAQKNPSDARIEYDLGVASYKTGDHDASAEHFQKSLLTDDDKFRKDVQYDLGNALYQSGISREDKDIKEALRRLELSLESFGKVMAADAGDADAQNNYEFVKKELERLKEKQQQQQQQQSKQCPLPKQGDKKEDQGDQKPQEQKDQGEPKDQDKPEEQQAPQDQGAQEKPQPSQEQQGGQKASEEQKDKEPPQEKDGAAGQNDPGQISSQKDANDVVDDFERNELPKGLLNFTPRSAQERQVVKDW